MTRRRSRVLRGALVATALAVVAAPAGAHAVLEHADPAIGAQLDRPPARVVLTFDEPVETSLGSLRLLDADGRAVETGAARHPDGDRTRLGTTVATLARGRYVVMWSVVSADSHIVSGAYAFGVGVPAGDAPPVAADPVAAVMTPIVHGTLLASALLAIGLPIGVAVLGGLGGPASFVEFAAWFIAALAAFADVALRAELTGGTLVASFATRAGELRSLTVAAAIAAIAALLGRRRNVALLVPAALVLVASLSLAGHAGTGPWPVVGALADALHLFAAAAWIGVLAIAVTVPPSIVLTRVTPIAATAVGAIVVTGIVQSVRDVGGWSPLLTTLYGRLVLTKIALLVGALACALVARRVLARGAFRIRRPIAVELGILAAIVAVTAVLVDLPLPRETVSLARVAVTLPVGGLAANVVATQTSPLGWSIRVDARDAGAGARRLDGASLTISEEGRGVGPVDIPLARAPDGAFTGSIAEPYAGDWRAFVSVRVGEFDEAHRIFRLEEKISP